MSSPTGGNPQAGLTTLIRLDDPVVTNVLAAAECDTARAGVAGICAVLKTWEFDLRLGPSPVYPDGHGNCLDLASLLTACVCRRGGQAYTMLGSDVGRFPDGMHAWTLVHEEAWLLVDPVDREPMPCQPGRLTDKYTILAIFNHKVAFLTPEDRRAFMEEAHDGVVEDPTQGRTIVNRTAG